MTTDTTPIWRLYLDAPTAPPEPTTPEREAAERNRPEGLPRPALVVAAFLPATATDAALAYLCDCHNGGRTTPAQRLTTTTMHPAGFAVSRLIVDPAPFPDADERRGVAAMVDFARRAWNARQRLAKPAPQACMDGASLPTANARLEA